jgi:hypothetical protein
VARPGRTTGAAALLAFGLACAVPGARVPIPPHLEAARPDDVPGARPTLGVLPFVDARPARSRTSQTPRLRVAVWGFKREGEEQTGDDRFAEPVGPAVRRDALATLLRSGAFSRVAPVADAAGAAGMDLLLAGTLEELVGTRFRSSSLDLLRLGWYRSRVDDPVGISRMHFRLFAHGELVWEDRIETWRQVAGERIERAALDAMAITNEKLAHRLYRHLVPRHAETRDLPLRVLDGCALGAKAVARRIADASELLEREADVRLIARIETWAPPRLDSGPEMLEHVRGLAPARAGALVALVPLAEPRGPFPEAQDFGLARQLGEHVVVTCRPDEPAHPTTLAHELAHLFGAVHVRDRASLLNPVAEFDARFLDPLNRRVLRETRTRPFGRPLPRATRRALEAVYRTAPPEVVRPVDVERALAALGPR